MTRQVLERMRSGGRLSASRAPPSSSAIKTLTDVFSCFGDSLLGQVGRPSEQLEPQCASDGQEGLPQSPKADESERLSPGQATKAASVT